MKLLYLFPLLLVASTNANYCGINTAIIVESDAHDDRTEYKCSCQPGYELTHDSTKIFDTWETTKYYNRPLETPPFPDGAECTEIPGNSGSQKALGSALGVSCALAALNYM